MARISIVIPVYNGAKFLNKTLESISKQTFKDVEVVCVDDGSTDNSLEKLNKLSQKYDFIKIISQKNQGSGKARNTGIENSTGEYIAFLDADDIYLDSDALEKMHDMAIKNNANIVSANLQFINKDYSIKENRHYERGDYEFFKEYSSISPDEYGIPYAFYKNIFKKEFLDSNGIIFPDLLRGQDPVFLAMAFANTNVIYTCPVNLYGYNYSIGGGVNNKMNNYLKKDSYVRHFRDTCDVLSEAGLDKTSNEYKLHFTRYLNWKKNNEDTDLFKIYGKLFKRPDEYFANDDENFIIFNASAQAYILYHTQDSDRFTHARDYLRTVDREVLPKRIRERYDIIINSDSLDDYQDNYYSFTIGKLEERNNYLKNKIDELTDENKRLSDKVSCLEKDVDAIKSSGTFKIAKKVKDIIK